MPITNRVRLFAAWAAALAGIGAIALVPRTGRTPGAIADGDALELMVHADGAAWPISPYIYGLAQPSRRHYEDLRLKLWRWGGNPASRYNWEKGNCWNAAADWEFRNGNYSHTSAADRRPSGVADQVIAEGRRFGCDALLTVPTLGWVARNDSTWTASTGVPRAGGPPITPGSDAIAGYDPAENRKRVSQRSLPRRGAPFGDRPNLSDDVVYQDEWIHHLVGRFGTAASGGVRFYAMDNEPDLWSDTHRDMHPAWPGRDEMLKQFLDYSGAVKDVDPTARVTGPVSWGWTGYFYSPLDRGADNYRTAADRKTHGGLPLLAWFLRQTAEYDRKQGRRSLDVLDVHYYPQGAGVYGGATDEATNRLRLRSTRALWDPTYTDESWIATPVQLLPRLRRWVQEEYPGTDIGLTEWNWGADGTMNGALAIAEVLGILGRERVSMACYWTAPPLDSPGFFAWKLFRNADGAGNGFGDRTITVDGSVTETLDSFGSIDSRTGYPVLMLVNKSPSQSIRVRVNFGSKRPPSGADLYRYSQSNLKSIVRLPMLSITNGQAAIQVPAYSLMLVRCR